MLILSVYILWKKASDIYCFSLHADVDVVEVLNHIFPDLKRQSMVDKLVVHRPLLSMRSVLQVVPFMMTMSPHSIETICLSITVTQ